MLYFYCDECLTTMEAPDCLRGRILVCPKCGYKNKVRSDRKLKKRIETKNDGFVELMLERLTDFEKAGIDTVRWLTAGDGFVCENCRKLSNVEFTIQEARLIIINHKCDPDDQLQPCRCCIRSVVKTTEKPSDQPPSVVCKKIIEGDKMRIVFDLSDDFLKKYGIKKE